jgi:REP element-mobilizing transposase RayT
MPCYLFTFHAYGTWLPDRKRGFVRRDGQGIHEQNLELADKYKKQMMQDVVRFDREVQIKIVEALQETSLFQKLRLHGIATDASHVHLLVSWKDDRKWDSIRRSLKHALTSHLNQIKKQQWLTRAGSRKHVKGTL